jgi:putative glutathione S-transferase
VIRFTVPVLWGKKLDIIVNNESSEIIRMFNTAFNHLLPADKAAIDIYPEAHHQEIDSINEWVYDTANSTSESVGRACLDDIVRSDGVYRSGFAQSQSAYENAVYPLFKSLDHLEEKLKGKDYLVGNTLTEADIRLFVTAIRSISNTFHLALNLQLRFRSALIPCTLAISNATCAISETHVP